MKILLISDTHGKNIDWISAYAEKVKADVCIHAGDFGFYDTNSVEAFSQRELFLQVKHSNIEAAEKTHILTQSAKGWKEAILKHKIFGPFAEFIADKRRFQFPIFATWGNHDDAEVVLRMIKDPVPNLQMLHEKRYYDMGEFAVLGLGGNCLPEKAFTQGYRGLPGQRCRPSSVLSQYVDLLKTARTIPAGKRIVLVTHVSPLVEPFIELLAWQIGADLTVSGHMGRKNGETGTTDNRRLYFLQQTYEKLLSLYPDAKDDLYLFAPETKGHSVQHINLPDAEDGYAVLDYAEGNFSFEIHGTDYQQQQRDELGELYNFAQTAFKFMTVEYSYMLPIADKIIAGTLSPDEEGNHIERMLHCLGYDKMSALLHKCCEAIIRRNPGYTVAILDDEHEMMEGSEAPYSDELRREYDFHTAKKNPCIPQ